MDKNNTELKFLMRLSYWVFISKISNSLSFAWVLSNLKLSTNVPYKVEENGEPRWDKFQAPLHVTFIYTQLRLKNKELSWDKNKPWEFKLKFNVEK